MSSLEDQPKSGEVLNFNHKFNSELIASKDTVVTGQYPRILQVLTPPNWIAEEAVNDNDLYGQTWEERTTRHNLTRALFSWNIGFISLISRGLSYFFIETLAMPLFMSDSYLSKTAAVILSLVGIIFGLIGNLSQKLYNKIAGI